MTVDPRKLYRAKKAVKKLATCPQHKRYQIKRKPRTLCEACWELWTFKKLFSGLAKRAQQRIVNDDDSMFRCSSRGDEPTMKRVGPRD